MADATVTIQMLFQAAGQENVRRALQEIHNEVRRLAAQSPRAAVFRTAGPAGEAFADLRNRLAAVRAMAAQMRAATQAVQQQIVTLKQTGAEVALTPAEIRMATARLAEIMSGRALFGRAPAGIAEALFGPEQLRAFHQGRERFERQIHDFIRQTGPSLGRMLRVGLDPSLVQGQLDAIHAIMTSRSMSIAERMRAAGTVMQGLVRSAFADPHLRRDLQDAIRQLTDWSTALEEAAAAGDQGAARLQRSLFRRFQEIQRILVGLAGAITTPRQALREMAEISRMTAVPESGFVRMLNEARAAGVSAGEIIGRVWVPSLERSIRVASLGTQSIRGYADQLADIAQRWAEMGEAGPARVREIAAQIGAELSRVIQVIRMRGRELSIPFATALAADLAQISRHAQAAVRSIERAPGVPQVILPRAQQLRELAGRLEEINRALAGVERTAGRGFMLRLGQELIAVTRQTWTVHQLAMAFRSTGMDIAFMGAAILGTGSAMALAAQNVARIMRTFEVTAGIPARMALQAREAMLRLGAEIGAGGEQVGQAMAVWARATGEVIATQDDLERVVARVAPVMALASIHGENMADVLARVVAAANIFRIGLDDLSRIVAVFNKVAIETPTTLIEIGDALRFVGPVARNAGASFEQVMAILQLAAAEGLRGGVAGRALRQMFIRFSESEQETRRLVRAVFGQAEPFFPGGRFVGLPRFIEMIARASEQMSEMQRAQMMAQLATANELPLLESLVALQREAARWARERGRAEFNVIEALEDAHRGIASQRALLLQEFLRETRGIQIEIRSAAEQWDQTFQRFVEHTATRWDRAMARLRGSLQVVGFGVQEFLVGNLERAAGAAESLIRVLGGAERAATLLGGALGRIAMFGFGVMGIGLAIRGLGNMLQAMLTLWMGQEALRRVIAAGGLGLGAGAAQLGALMLSPRALAITAAAVAMTATGDVRIAIAAAAGGALAGHLIERVVGPALAAGLAGLFARLGLAGLGGSIASLASAISGAIPPVLAVAAAMAALAVVVDRVVAAMRGNLMGPGLISDLIASQRQQAERAASAFERLRWLRENVPGGAELARRIEERATIFPGMMTGLAGDILLQPTLDIQALERELDRLGVPKVPVEAEVTRVSVRPEVEAALREWKIGEIQAGMAMPGMPAVDLPIFRVMRMAFGEAARGMDVSVIGEFLHQIVWEVPYQFRLAEERTSQAISDMWREVEESIRRGWEELQVRIARMRGRLAEEEAEEEEDRARQRARRERDFQRRLAEMIEDHQREMARMEQDHRDRILDLVAERNALALVQEMRDYAKRRERAEEDFQVRLRRMREQFGEEQKEEEEERARRRARRRQEMERQIMEMIEDFNRQAALRRQDAAARAAQLQAQLEQERRMMYEQMARRLQEQLGLAREFTIQELSIHGQRYADLLRMLIAFAPREKEILQKVLEDYLRWLEEMMRSRGGGGGGGGGRPGGPTPYQMGGYVRETGLALLHRGEFVLPAWAVEALERRWGPLSPARIAGGGPVMITIQAPMSIHGTDPEGLARVLERHRERLVREVARAMQKI